MLAVVLALCAAAVFGTATALQHRAASDDPRADARPGRLVARLLRRPGWLVGVSLSAVAFVLHVAALDRGPLTLVQPIVVTTVVFAVLVRSALDRTLPDRAEVVWCVCTWVGLVLFVTMVGGSPPHPVPDERAAGLFLLAGAAAAATAVVAAGWTRPPARRGFLLGAAAGILYGLTAGLVKTASSYARPGLAAMFDHWSPWLVAPAGLTAFYLSQRAYQATRLSVSAPVLNIVDVVVAVTFGALVFSDRLYVSPGRLVVELVGAAAMGVGVWQLVQESERLHERQARAAVARPLEPADPEADRRLP